MTETRKQRLDRRYATERLDVLETEMPRAICGVKGCERSHPLYPIAGVGDRTFHVCSRHIPMYRRHNEILRRIRAL